MRRIIRNKFLSIYIISVNYPNDVKARPALVLEIVPQHKFRVLRITHVSPRQKSKKIGKNYYTIRYWQEAGLDRPSYIDTNRYYDVPISKVTQEPPIGKLTSDDSAFLFHFLITQKRIKFLM